MKLSGSEIVQIRINIMLARGKHARRIPFLLKSRGIKFLCNLQMYTLCNGNVSGSPPGKAAAPVKVIESYKNTYT